MNLLSVLHQLTVQDLNVRDWYSNNSVSLAIFAKRYNFVISSGLQILELRNGLIFAFMIAFVAPFIGIIDVSILFGLRSLLRRLDLALLLIRYLLGLVASVCGHVAWGKQRMTLFVPYEPQESLR